MVAAAGGAPTLTSTCPISQPGSARRLRQEEEDGGGALGVALGAALKPLLAELAQLRADNAQLAARVARLEAE